MRRRTSLAYLGIGLTLLVTRGWTGGAPGLASPDPVGPPGGPTIEPPPSPAPAATGVAPVADRAPVLAPPVATPVAPAPPLPGVTPTPAPAPTARVFQGTGEFLYVPASARPQQPTTVLVALHGVGAEGRSFCKELLVEAEQNRWIVLAPTFSYQNWHDPAAVTRDDLTILPRLKAMIDGIPERVDLPTRRRVLLYGFSRGGQVAHRFALAYPERVGGVAALAAGTYTLPVGEWTTNGARRTLPLPYGTADLRQRLDVTADPAALKQVAFWIGVGGNDNRDGDVPAAWTPYIGPNRVARARAFAAALERQGVPSTLTIFPGVDHREAPEMRSSASAFLRGLATE